ncbi:sulfatase [Sinomicrobium soli]|uniref:sulfatase n=1 Tax=Sinomicrobium sp. N-1-3-6 TaxID=2219864 RepID=UPI000DCEE4AE|nr:sulfatase [Sinomicrobium sp. N-1-3-6]RAV28202.1 iduronate-2-sulfatase [Sinomicrobium sp. N-1-3-6]
MKTQLASTTLHIFLICMCSVTGTKAQQTDTAGRKNILFIAVDDLRPELGCYGAGYVKTPNIDKLASKGVLFENAYCQQAICAPSRNSVMTGLRPDALNIYDLSTFFRTTVPDVVTLPQHLKNNGYISEAVGKIYHEGHNNRDDILSWSRPSWDYKTPLKNLKKVKRGDTTDLQSDFPKINGELLPFYKSNAPETNMTDAVIADIAVERLHQLKDRPFFMAVGFKNPHLPFVAPAKYWNMYKPEDIRIPERNDPDGVSRYAFARWSGELNKYHGISQYKTEGYLPDDLSRNLIHGYYAAVSQVDDLIGQLITTLEELGVRDNTIIVLWGDHGWKLGEYGMWAKHSNCELDTRAPLIISAPGFSGGKKSESLAELLDIYPTLCELSGTGLPDHLQGKSLVPVLKDPTFKVRETAMSQYPRGKYLKDDPTKREIMGYSITDGRYRFTRWQSYKNPDRVLDRELYDHHKGRIDLSNLARLKEYDTIVRRMEKLLNDQLAHNR